MRCHGEKIEPVDSKFVSQSDVGVARLIDEAICNGVGVYRNGDGLSTQSNSRASIVMPSFVSLVQRHHVRLPFPVRQTLAVSIGKPAIIANSPDSAAA